MHIIWIINICRFYINCIDVGVLIASSNFEVTLYEDSLFTVSLEIEISIKYDRLK